MSHHSVLTRSIDVDHGLLYHLLRCDLITYSQKQLITQPNRTLEDKVGHLLDWITQKWEIAPETFDKFIACLRANAQHHVANLLQVRARAISPRRLWPSAEGRPSSGVLGRATWRASG